MAELSSNQEVCYTVRQLSEMFKDDINFFNMIFVDPIINEYDRLNDFFQATDIGPEIMTKELDIHHKSLKQQLFSNHGHSMALLKVDFVSHFASQLMFCE